MTEEVNRYCMILDKVKNEFVVLVVKSHLLLLLPLYTHRACEFVLLTK